MRAPQTRTRARSRRRLVPFILLLAASAFAAQATDDAFGRSPADLAMEDFLLHGSVVDIEDVGSGITKPKRITLRRGGVERRAIFKTIDSEIEGIVIADRVERGFSDRYTYEIAAYRLDRLAGLGLVPVTVERTIDGDTGSLQEWIEDVMSFEDMIKDSNARIENFDLLVHRLGLMYVLDALIDNVDRNYGNILVNLDQDIFHPIDHSRAFRLSRKPQPSTHGATDTLDVPKNIAQRLRAIDLETLNSLIGDLLQEKQIRAILKRRDRLVRMIDKGPA